MSPSKPNVKSEASTRVKMSMHKISPLSKYKRSAPKHPPPKGVVPPQFVPTVWQKGQSGNPGGAPKRATEVVLLARSYTLDAIRTLALLMLDENVKPRDRAYCADIILDRGLGKAPMTVKLEADEEAAREGLRKHREAAVQDIDRVKQIVEIWPRPAPWNRSSTLRVNRHPARCATMSRSRSSRAASLTSPSPRPRYYGRYKYCR